MAGIDPITGTVLDEIGDIRRSIADIIKTPVGTRVMRRDYGSHIADLVDSPGNEVGALRLIAAAADGIARWEPRVTMTSARLVPAMDGTAAMEVVCRVNASGLSITANARTGAAA